MKRELKDLIREQAADMKKSGSQAWRTARNAAQAKRDHEETKKHDWKMITEMRGRI